ncbi:hypothetical protein [Robinsoniella peoriensis]|uniref:hypothetical protein n=1 Tax=Robinsoniella peoriensis TaxID=180332 RepID=UPI00363593AA
MKIRVSFQSQQGLDGVLELLSGYHLCFIRKAYEGSAKVDILFNMYSWVRVQYVIRTDQW